MSVVAAPPPWIRARRDGTWRLAGGGVSLRPAASTSPSALAANTGRAGLAGSAALAGSAGWWRWLATYQVSPAAIATSRTPNETQANAANRVAT
jgi:hypothetical protein